MENNPYRPRSMLWALVEEDFSDLTAQQIAEVFDTTDKVVYQTMARIRHETGYNVRFARKRKKRRNRHETNRYFRR